MAHDAFTSPCPCGSQQILDACCGPLLRGERWAETAETLMRSRFSAYALGETNHVFRTWHPRTRPDDLTPEPGLVWTRLEILDTADGGPSDETGIVEFKAHFTVNGRPDVLHERSRFARRANRWLYLDGDIS